MTTANELKVPVYSVEEFVAEFNVPIRVKEQSGDVIVDSGGE